MRVLTDDRNDSARPRTDSMSAPASGNDVHEVLEAVCRRGCRYVLQVIAALERNDIPKDLSGLGLDLDRRTRVLAELQAIMAVYDRECGLDPGEATGCGGPDSIRK